MADNPALFPPQISTLCLLQTDEKSTRLHIFASSAGSRGVNLSIKPSGRKKKKKVHMRRARHSFPVAASPRLCCWPYFPEDNSKEPSNCSSYPRRHFHATTYRRSPARPPARPAALFISFTQTERTRQILPILSLIFFYCL